MTSDSSIFTNNTSNLIATHYADAATVFQVDQALEMQDVADAISSKDFVLLTDWELAGLLVPVVPVESADRKVKCIKDGSIYFFQYIP